MNRTTLALLFVSFFLCLGTVEAQKKKGKKKNKLEKQARAMATEMDKALDLTDEEFDAVLKIQIDKRKEGNKIKSNSELSQEERKKQLKKLGNRVYNQMKDALGGGEQGKSRLKKWKQYKKDKKNKS